MSFVTKFQAESMSPVLFTMNKDLLKLIPKIAADPFYGNDANWFRVSFVFKHTQSRKRFVPSFLNFSATKRLKVRNGMNGGDEYTLKKIIISKSDRSHFVILESEIPDVANFNFALLGEGGQPDLVGPMLISLTGPSGGEYTGGDSLNFNLNFDETVFVTGQPKLYLDVGFAYKEASYISGSGSQSLLFRYIVGNTDLDSEGIQLDSFNLNNGTIQDAAGNNATIDISSSSLNIITIQNDITGPFIQNVTSTSPSVLLTGDVLSVSVNFSEPVVVSGNPLLILNLDGVSKSVAYSETNDSSVIFNLSIGQDDFAQYNLTAQQINLNGGAIQDLSGNNVSSTNDVITFTYVTLNSQINPDTVNPTIQMVEVLTDVSSPLLTGNIVQFGVNFSEEINYTGSPRLVLSINSQTKYATIVEKSGSNLLFEYTVTSQDIGDISVNSFDLNGGTVEDNFGNVVEENVNLSFTSFLAGAELNPDVVAPTVLSVTGEEGDYVIGDSIGFSVQFSEDIAVSNANDISLRLTLDNGTVDVPMVSLSGSTIQFSLTVGESDLAAETLTISSIQIGSGFIKDLAGNNANLGFTALTKQIVINNSVEPAVYTFGSTTTFRSPYSIVDSNGKHLLYGQTVTRLNQDGTPDTGFSIGTGFNGSVSKVIHDTSGKYVAVGTFTTCNGSTANGIVRLNSNGSVDSTFLANSAFNGICGTVIQDSNAKYLVTTTATTYNGTTIGKLVRLNSDGSLDSSFATVSGGAGFDTAPGIVFEDSSGKYIVSGYTAYQGNSSLRRQLVRLNSDGTTDTSFPDSSVTNGFTNTVYAAFQDSSGKYVFAGDLYNYNNVSINKIIRLNYNGTIDSSFNMGSGFSFSNIVYAAIEDSSGKYVLTGNLTNLNGSTTYRVLRLNSSGSLDSTFNVGTGFNSIAFSSIAKTSSGKYVFGGGFSSYNGTSAPSGLIRVNSDGTLDSTFTSQHVYGFDNYPNKILRESSGKLLFVGNFTNYKGTPINRIVRLNSDGSIDSTFNVGTGFNQIVYDAVLDASGKYIVVGNFIDYNGTSINRIVRLNSDGSIDSTFNVGTGFNSAALTIIPDTTGKYVVGGNFTTYKGVGANRMIRLDSSGTTDSTFSIGTGFNNQVNRIVRDSSGKYIVVGNFTLFSGSSVVRIARLNSNGSIDSTLSSGTGFGASVQDIIITSSGKYLIGGSFTAYNGTTVNRIVRLNTNGTVDSTFAIGTGFNSGVNFMLEESNGSIVVGGVFTTYNGSTAGRIIRLNSDGSVDSTFAAGTGFTSSTYAILKEPAGNYIIGGFFSSYNGKLFGGLIRIQSNGGFEVP